MSIYEDNDAAYDEAERITEAIDTSLQHNDWFDLFRIRCISAGAGDNFGFEVYVGDPEMESDPTYESDGFTAGDAWGVAADLDALLQGRLIPDDVRAAIGAAEQ